MIGDVVCGYRLVRELGARPLPTFAALDGKTKRPAGALCVVEVLAREGSAGTGPAEAAAFVRDAKRIALTNHPNLVHVREVAVGANAVLCATDWIEGELLGDVTRLAAERHVPVALGASLRIVVDLLEGLSALHELRGPKREEPKLVHAEVAPRNVVVTLEGRARLTHLVRGPVVATRKPAPEVVGYLAPEVLLGDLTADQRADVYGVGVLLWEALMGRRMHADGEPAGEIVVRILGGRIDAAHAPIDAPWAAGLAAAAARATSPDPAARFASATEMLAEVRRVAGVNVAPKAKVAALVESVAGDRVRARAAEIDPSRTVHAAAKITTSEAPAPASSRTSVPVAIDVVVELDDRTPSVEAIPVSVERAPVSADPSSLDPADVVEVVELEVPPDAPSRPSAPPLPARAAPPALPRRAADVAPPPPPPPPRAQSLSIPSRTEFASVAILPPGMTAAPVRSRARLGIAAGLALVALVATWLVVARPGTDEHAGSAAPAASPRDDRAEAPVAPAPVASASATAPQAAPAPAASNAAALGDELPWNDAPGPAKPAPSASASPPPAKAPAPSTPRAAPPGAFPTPAPSSVAPKKPPKAYDPMGI